MTGAPAYAPVTGTVSAVNAALTDAPETVNRDAHEAGWICKLKLAKPAELDGLLDAAAYGALAGG